VSKRDNGVMSGAMILTGAPGSGKSSVLNALSTSLELEEVAFGAIESEQLARGCPWLEASQWVPQLAAIIELQKKAGRDMFLVVATTETEEELRGVIDAVGVDRVVVICLSAPAEVVAQRVADREPDSWPGKTALVERARRLAEAIPSIPSVDLIIQTVDRRPVDVAAEVTDALLARGLLAHA
jgi:chloramphenicol 3-O-phosphotransferase